VVNFCRVWNAASLSASGGASLRSGHAAHIAGLSKRLCARARACVVRATGAAAAVAARARAAAARGRPFRPPAGRHHSPTPFRWRGDHAALEIFWFWSVLATTFLRYLVGQPYVFMFFSRLTTLCFHTYIHRILTTPAR
jgi:hypothetical protein